MPAYTPNTPLIGGHPPAPARLRAIVAAIRDRPNGEYDQASVETIVRAYALVAETAGMDPIMPIAQMLHETGWLSSWWSQRPHRNPAGIGVTGRTSPTQPLTGFWAHTAGGWAEGCSFATWKDDAVPAHLGRLLAYALPDWHGTDAQQRLIAVALAYRPLPASYRGAAPTWLGLNGRWAVPGTTYAQAIARIANTLLPA